MWRPLRLRSGAGFNPVLSRGLYSWSLTKNGSPNHNGEPPIPKTKKCSFTWATLYVYKVPFQISEPQM